MKLIRKLAVSWWGVGLALLLGVIIGYLIFPLTTPTQTNSTTASSPQITIITPPTAIPTDLPITPLQTNRTLWESHGITNYRIVISTLALPSPWVTRDVKVEASEIIQADLVPCPNIDVGACSYGSEAMRYVASHVSRATIEDLFAVAETCTHQTIAALNQCAAFAPYASTGFSSGDDMYAISRRCLGDEFDLSVNLCRVEYDPTYGFPIAIHQFIPNAIDGEGIVVVDEFEVLE
jgi:hypothetical protein